MKAFATLFSQLDQTNKTTEKVNLLRQYLAHASPNDKLWMLALFSHRRPKRQVKTSLLKLWARELAQLPEWLFDETYHTVGDLSETIALVLPPNARSNHFELTDWIQFLDELNVLDESQKKEKILWAWDHLDQIERLVFNKLITGGFRIGVSNQLVIKAVADEFQIDPNTVAHRLMGDWSPFDTDFQRLVLEESPNEDSSKPYPFFLAYPLEGELQDLGSPGEWLAEWKWDGIRSQTIIRNSEIFIWSRGEELITEKFPELKCLKDILPKGTVIDGELMAFKDGKPMFFQDLQTRIGRKTVSKKLLADIPVIIRAYDLLEYQGQDLRNKPLSYRRAQLNELITSIIVPAPIMVSQSVMFSSWENLIGEKDQARTHFAEGIMLKKLQSTYQVGRKKGDWWKWKLDPFTIDAVMIYAQKGHGRRADLYSDYTFGIWDQGRLVSFTKAYSGLTDKEMAEVDRFVKQNTLEKFGPVRTVKPELVFEIAFEGIQASNRHKSGVALRFPRIKSWRKDKPASESNTLDDLKQLLNQYGNK